MVKMAINLQMKYNANGKKVYFLKQPDLSELFSRDQNVLGGKFYEIHFLIFFDDKFGFFCR